MKRGKALCIERRSLVKECLQELFALEVMPKLLPLLSEASGPYMNGQDRATWCASNGPKTILDPKTFSISLLIFTRMYKVGGLEFHLLPESSTLERFLEPSLIFFQAVC